MFVCIYYIGNIGNSSGLLGHSEGSSPVPLTMVIYCEEDFYKRPPVPSHLSFVDRETVRSGQTLTQPSPYGNVDKYIYMHISVFRL